MGEQELHPCPYSKATTCSLREGCKECEVFSEYLNGETKPRLKQ